MPPDPVRVEDTKAWLVRAIEDLNVAEHDMRAPEPFLRPALFHCQQGVEKALKGFLTWHDQPFEKTHDLRRLGKQCINIDPELESILKPSFALTEAAWQFRYPGEIDDPTLEEARHALSLGRRVLAALLDRLPAEVRP